MFPLEPITALIGLGVGAYVKIKQQQNETLQLAMKDKKQLLDDVKHARQASSKLPNVQWTKRVLAFMMLGTYCALHLGVGLQESSVVIGYTEIVPKFLFFGEKEAVKWATTTGSAITPAFSHAVMLITGYYFGSGGSRR